MRMRFGKFKGYELEDIPLDYLEWLVKSIPLREPLRSAVNAEYARRSQSQKANTIVDADIAAQIIGAGLRALAKKHHPDMGGSHEQMVAINDAAEWLRARCR